jgi:hypothetical protein
VLVCLTTLWVGHTVRLFILTGGFVWLQTGTVHSGMEYFTSIFLDWPLARSSAAAWILLYIRVASFASWFPGYFFFVCVFQIVYLNFWSVSCLLRMPAIKYFEFWSR